MSRRSYGRIGVLSILVLGLSVLPALPAVAARLKPSRLYVLGGTRAVSADTETALRPYVS